MRILHYYYYCMDMQKGKYGCVGKGNARTVSGTGRGASLDQRWMIFAAMASDSRIEIVKILRESEHCACELAAMLGLDISVISRHMAVLKRAGLIIARRDGVTIYYRLADARVVKLLEVAKGILKGHTEARLEALNKL